MKLKNIRTRLKTDLDNLGGKVPFKVYIGILISLFAAFGLWSYDVVSDGYLANQYYNKIFNGTFNQNQSCIEKNISSGNPTSPCKFMANDCMIFDETQSTETNKYLSCEQVLLYRRNYEIFE